MPRTTSIAARALWSLTRALCAAAALHAWAAAAAAQSDDGAPAGYREAIAAAIAEYEAASYVEAREQFRRAHHLAPSARTLRGLGITEYELHNYPEAVTYLQSALASDVKRLEGSVRRDTEAVLVRARGYVGTLTIELDPPSAHLMIDGRRTDVRSGHPTLLSVGEHWVDVRAPGRLAERRAVTIHGGETHVLRLKLLDAPSAAATNGLPATERPGPTPLYKRWWLWSAVAVIAGGAATAAILLTQRDVVYREVPEGTPHTPAGPTLTNAYGGR